MLNILPKEGHYQQSWNHFTLFSYHTSNHNYVDLMSVKLFVKIYVYKLNHLFKAIHAKVYTPRSLLSQAVFSFSHIFKTEELTKYFH